MQAAAYHIAGTITSDASHTTLHKVTLTGLDPSTTYHYKVSSGTAETYQ